MRRKKCAERISFHIKLKCFFATIILLALGFSATAQDGSAGIEQANTQVRSYFDVGCNLMYAIGAVLGLVGAIRVYQK